MITYWSFRLPPIGKIYFMLIMFVRYLTEIPKLFHKGL